MESKKIALISHVNPFAKGSGQNQRVFNTLLALAKTHEFVFIYTLNENQSEDDRLNQVLKLNSNIKIKYLHRKYSYLLPIFKLYFYLGLGKKSNGIIPYIFEKYKKSIKKENFDVIIFEYWYLFRLANFLKTKDNKIICDTHDILSNTFEEHLKNKKWIPKWYKKIIFKKYKTLEFEIALPIFDILIAINRNEEKVLKINFPCKEVYYIPMGIKLEKHEFNIESKFNIKENFNIAYYGGLGLRKNAIDAVRVFNSLEVLKNNEIRINYKIIGSNPPQFIKNLKSDNIEIVGYVENLEKAFKNIDLAVIPFSGKYGFRSRIIELMYYGVPVLTSNDAVWGMGFTKNDNIFIFDDENNFSNQIKDLLNDSLKREKIASNAQEKVLKEFTFEETYDKFSKIIHQF